MKIKTLILKTISFTIALYMILGNILISGIGLGKVIAEDIKTPNIVVETQTLKYVQYSKEDYKGTILQEKISLSEENITENYLPVSKVEMQITTPQINNCFPERVNIINANMALTNGKTEGVNVAYDNTTGIISMSYENTKDENGNYYSEYNENTKDEFEIIYIYPAGAYLENSPEIEISTVVNANVEYYLNDTTTSIQVTKTNTRKQKDNIGDVASIEMTDASTIYKGYMYSNEENKTSYTTEYQTVSDLNILNSQIIDEINIKFDKSNYLKEDGEIVPTDTIIYYDTIIDETSFNKILGQDGYADIYIDSVKYATVKYSTADEDENRKYIVEYANSGVIEESSGKVTYADGVKSIQIVTSKPLTEGTLIIQNHKGLKQATDVQISCGLLSAVSEQSSVEATKKDVIEQTKTDESGNILYDENGNEQKEQVEKSTQIVQNSISSKIKLNEPYSQVNMEFSNNNFSTLTTNTTTLTVKLNDTNSSCKLFEAGTMKITLPQNLTSSKITNAQALYTNGLTVKSAKISDGKIILNIEGNQTAYDTTNISGGVNIILDLELDIEDTTPTHDETLNLTYNNITASSDVKIVSKEGVLNYATLSGYNDDEEITAIDETEQTANIDVGEETKQVKLQATIVNNYDTDLDNVEIIGKLPSTGNKDVNGNDIGSNIDTCLLTEVSVDDEDAIVYYSDSEDATVDSDTWTTTATKSAKAYKIELANDTLSSKEDVEFEYQFEVPANLTYNEEAITTYSMDYEVEGIAQTSNSTLTLATTEVPEISVSIEPNIDLDYVTGGQIVEYDITVENKSDYDVNDLSMQIPIQDGQTYTEYTSNAFGEDYVQGGYKPDSSIKTKEYNNISLKSGEKLTKKIFLKMSDVSNETTINNIVNILNGEGNTISTTTYTTTVKPKQIIVENVYYTTRTSLNEGEKITYDIYIENNSNSDINNIKIIDKLDDDLELEKVENLTADDKSLPYEISRNNELTITFGTLSANDSALIEITVITTNNTKFTKKEIGNKVKLVADGIYDHESEIVYYTVSGFLPSIELETTADTNVKEYEQIDYIITIKNQSDAAKEIKIVDKLPEQITAYSYDVYIYDKDGNQIENNTSTLSTSDLQISQIIYENETIIVKVHCDIGSIGDEESVEVNNKVILYYGGYDETNDNYIEKEYIESNTITNVIEQSEEEPKEDTGMVEVEDPIDDDIPEYKSSNTVNSGDDNNNSENTENNTANGNNSGSSNTGNNNYAYTIRGKAWIDEDKNGKRDNSENGISSIKVILIDNATGNIALNSSSNQIIAYTTEDGSYILENVPNGEYLVVFEYDSNTYTVTSYQKQGVDDSNNCDVISKEITINGEKKVRAITDVIQINGKGMSNIDIGLIKSAKFDLSLDKQISSITVKNAKGTKTTNYDNKDFAKIDLVAKYMNNTNMIITYKFVITNNGDVAGYVDELVDDLPSGLEFNSELNKDWYKGSDGKLHTKSLSGISISSGGTSEVELILTKKTTENTTGTFTNNAELTSISNIEALQEQTDAKQNNKSSADIVISIKTGSIIMYIGITLLCLGIIGIGILIIKNKVLNKEI